MLSCIAWLQRLGIRLRRNLLSLWLSTVSKTATKPHAPATPPVKSCYHQHRRAAGAIIPRRVASPARSRRKPDWVRKAVLNLAIHLPDASCRVLAAEFNRQHPSLRVGKTWVADLLREHAYTHLHRWRLLKKKPPKVVGHQVFWGLDLCFCTDDSGQTHAVLGLCEHQSRRALVLERLPNKRSDTILARIRAAVQYFGPPQVLLTDNEAVFTSAAFSQGLRELGICHRRIPRGKPWRNGRIERLFGTLKRKQRQTPLADGETLDSWLAAFRFWYEYLRPHQNLNGWTPMEVWNRQQHTSQRWGLIRPWPDGSLNGFYPLE